MRAAARFCASALVALVAGAAVACGNGGRSGSDAGTDAGYDGGEAGPSCATAAPCSGVAECVQPGTVAACWQCLLGCCIAVPPSNDPAKACDAGSPCAVAACDGAGSCTRPATAKDGTPCGTTCGGVFVFGRSVCQSGICVGVSSSQSACPDRCYGDYTDCPACDPPGCIASCDPLTNHPDRCFP